MKSLLQDREESRRLARLSEWQEARERLFECLTRHLPGHRVWLFGSVTEPGRFNSASDIDLALESEPASLSIYTLTALVEEAMHRPVDVVLLPENRLRNKILATGELWTL